MFLRLESRLLPKKVKLRRNTNFRSSEALFYVNIFRRPNQLKTLVIQVKT
jgi:hypothetical protein